MSPLQGPFKQAVLAVEAVFPAAAGFLAAAAAAAAAVVGKRTSFDLKLQGFGRFKHIVKCAHQFF